MHCPSTLQPVKPSKASRTAKMTKAPQSQAELPFPGPAPVSARQTRFFYPPAPARPVAVPAIATAGQAPKLPHEKESTPGGVRPIAQSANPNPAWKPRQQNPARSSPVPALPENSTLPHFYVDRQLARCRHRPRHTWQCNGDLRPGPLATPSRLEMSAFTKFR